MRRNPANCRVRHEPDKGLIRDYAEHLYEQSGRIPGHDLDNWLEAEACLRAIRPEFHGHRHGDADETKRDGGSAVAAMTRH